jgi:hypothetical protein
MLSWPSWVAWGLESWAGKFSVQKMKAVKERAGSTVTEPPYSVCHVLSLKSFKLKFHPFLKETISCISDFSTYLGIVLPSMSACLYEIFFLVIKFYFVNFNVCFYSSPATFVLWVMSVEALLKNYYVVSLKLLFWRHEFTSKLLIFITFDFKVKISVLIIHKHFP